MASSPQSTLATENPEDHFHQSIFSQKYKITDIRSDNTRWNRDWEEVLRNLTAQEAFSELKRFWELRDAGVEAQHLRIASMIEKRLLDVQHILLEIWKMVEEKGHFDTAWLLLPDKDRRQFLLKAIEEALCETSLRQDARALCPEISIRAMLGGNGKAYIDFIKGFANIVKDDKSVYHLPSDWWTQAAHEPANEPEPGHVFSRLALQRAEFIGQFVMKSMVEVIAILAAPKGSSRLHPAVEMMDIAGPGFASSMTDVIADMSAKPIIRCENCEKSPEEIANSPRFAMCSVCKKNLNHVVHYCSSSCQKADWPKHKKHCGKKKASKKLKGTINDPFRAVPGPFIPDHLRSLGGGGEGINLNDVGFADPGSEQNQSPALKRQLSMLNGDKDADYFLFDNVDRPVRFRIPDPMLRMTFRMMRSSLFSARLVGTRSEFDSQPEAVWEYLIKAMQGHPSLSRERILGQLRDEYGDGIEERLKKWSELGAIQGVAPGTTFLEDTNVKMTSTLPHMMALHPEILGGKPAR